MLAKNTQNRVEREGGGRVSWGLKEAGNFLSWNLSYRAVGPPSATERRVRLVSLPEYQSGRPPT